MKPTLEQMMENAIKASQSFYKDGTPDAEQEPTWMALTHDGKMNIIITPFLGETPQEAEQCKARIALLMSATFLAEDVERYVFISEAWIATVTDKTEQEIANLAPSDRMDRREAAVFVGVERGREGLIRTFELKRTPGRPTEMLESEAGFRLGGGRFQRMLDSPRATPERRKKIKEFLTEIGAHNVLSTKN